MKTPIADRRSAGIALAQALMRAALPGPIVVLALPRGTHQGLRQRDAGTAAVGKWRLHRCR